MGSGLIASIPSPARNQVHLGPIPLRGYALCVILAVVAGVVIGGRRLRRDGYPAGVVADIAVWGVPFGLVGARLDHVLTDHQHYLGHGHDWVTVFAIWDGGLGIWGAVALGAVGAWIGCRQYGVRPSRLADALAVGLPVAQAIGRWGNWFNQELYGRPSSLPWAVHIDAAHRLPQYAADATYQPAFLYESIWDLGVAGFVLMAERRQWFGRLSRGRAFALYVAAYTVGRAWIEALRVDPAPHLLGMRLGDVIAITLFALAVGYLVAVRPGVPDQQSPSSAPTGDVRGETVGTAGAADPVVRTTPSGRAGGGTLVDLLRRSDRGDEPGEPDRVGNGERTSEPTGHEPLRDGADDDTDHQEDADPGRDAGDDAEADVAADEVELDDADPDDVDADDEEGPGDEDAPASPLDALRSPLRER